MFQLKNIKVIKLIYQFEKTITIFFIFNNFYALKTSTNLMKQYINLLHKVTKKTDFALINQFCFRFKNKFMLWYFKN